MINPFYQNIIPLKILVPDFIYPFWMINKRVAVMLIFCKITSLRFRSKSSTGSCSFHFNKTDSFPMYGSLLLFTFSFSSKSISPLSLVTNSHIKQHSSNISFYTITRFPRITIIFTFCRFRMIYTTVIKI